VTGQHNNSAVETILGDAVAALDGRPREGQQRMVAEVVQAIDNQCHLLVQAGTGTGKSLGYLVPSVWHAVTAEAQVVVSTATLALQRQLLTRDLPLVADVAARHLPRPPTFALLKGWHHYLCLHKIGGGYPVDDGGLFAADSLDMEPSSTAQATPPGRKRARDKEGPGLVDQVRRLHAWAKETDTGDRDDLVPGVSAKAWSQVSVTALECLGSACPMVTECFADQARSAAKNADIVVTNHAMLGIAAGGSPGVLPEHDLLVVDEAHELTDRVTSAATVELSLTTIDQAARLVRRHAALPTTALDTAAQTVGNLLASMPAERFENGLPDSLHEAVASVRDAARELLSDMRPDGSIAAKEAAADGGAKVAQSALLVIFETAERMAADDTSADVLWLSRPGEGATPARGVDGVIRLYAAPLHVAGLIRNNLLETATGVFTSATLTLGGRFEGAAQALGLGAGTDGVSHAGGGEGSAQWQGVDVGSPFDYPKQGILYVAEHLPAPGREPATEAQLEEIAALIEAAGGRTLGLFSSRRAAECVAEAMRDRLDVPILTQWDDQVGTLQAEFLADPATCLFGTLTLWQGIDVPGPSCQLVIIDRIAFPRPDDPIASARTRAVAQAGGNGFMAVSASSAALKLAQGAGRLIRSVSDKGVVAVLDPRLTTRRYGEFLRRSMPDFWPTTNREVVLAALRRLDEAAEAAETAATKSEPMLETPGGQALEGAENGDDLAENL
jgi:ATP-dependent DNA helicase DinG